MSCLSVKKNIFYMNLSQYAMIIFFANGIEGMDQFCQKADFKEI